MTLDNKAWLLVKCIASIKRNDDQFICFLVSQSRALLDERKNSGASIEDSVTRRDLFRRIWS